MSKGWRNQLTRQIGEHLVTAELGRRNYAATPFAGNIPDWDLLAADEGGHVVPIQVKAIRYGSWQFDIRKYLDVTLGETEQIVGDPVRLRHPSLMCIYVHLREQPPDEYFLFTLAEIQQRILGWFHQRKLPAKIESFHCAFRPRDISEFKERWDVLETAFERAQRIEVPT